MVNDMKKRNVPLNQVQIRFVKSGFKKDGEQQMSNPHEEMATSQVEDEDRYENEDWYETTTPS